MISPYVNSFHLCLVSSLIIVSFKKKVGVSDGVEVSLDPDAIDLDQGKLQEKYDEQLRKQVSNQFCRFHLARVLILLKAASPLKSVALVQQKI